MPIKNKRRIALVLVAAALTEASVHPATATEFDFSYTGLSGGAAINAAIIYSGATITEFKGTSTGLSAYGLGPSFDMTTGLTTTSLYYASPAAWVYEFTYNGGTILNVASDNITDFQQWSANPSQRVSTARINAPGTVQTLPYGGGSIAATPAPVPGSGPLSYLALAVGILLYNRKRLLGMAKSLTIRLSHKTSARS